MRRKKSSKPKCAKIKVTSSVAEKGALVVFTMYDDDGDDESPRTVPFDELLKRLQKKDNGVITDEIEVVPNVARAQQVAKRFGSYGRSVYIAHICTVTEQKLEKWPGAGC